MPSAPELPKIGDAVADRFALRKVLGEGGMGVVYEAFDNERDRPCALKILYPDFCGHPQIVARFDREAQITAKLEGPNVARVFEVGALPSGLRFIAMELLEGKDVATAIEEQGRLPVATAVDVAMQAAQAMVEAHALGVVHRDIKPENLFLVAGPSERPLVKVLDFGISRLVQGGEHLTRDFAQLGTPLYMSPEQIEAPSRVDERTDVWSLGVVLYEMIVGRPPFEGEGTGVLVAIATRPVPPPSSVVDDLPPGLEAVMMRALEKSPDARFQSMKALFRALAPWAPGGHGDRRRRAVRRVALVGVATALTVGVVAIALHPRATLALADGELWTTAPSASASAAPAGSASAKAAGWTPSSAAASMRRAPTNRGSQTPHAGPHPSSPRNAKHP